MIENPRTGELVELLLETPELLRMDVTWTRPGVRALRWAELVRRRFAGEDPAGLLDELGEEIVLAP